MTDKEIGWLAGMLDAEGCIYVNPQGSLVVMVTNCDAAIILRLVHLAGGRFYGPGKTRLRKPTHRPLYQWHIGGEKAVGLLKLVRSELVSKADQADLIIQHGFTTYGRGHRISSPVRQQRQEIRKQLKVLKGRLVS